MHVKHLRISIFEIESLEYELVERYLSVHVENTCTIITEIILSSGLTTLYLILGENILYTNVY